jgi:hypothetical protein
MSEELPIRINLRTPQSSGFDMNDYIDNEDLATTKTPEGRRFVTESEKSGKKVYARLRSQLRKLK